MEFKQSQIRTQKAPKEADLNSSEENNGEKSYKTLFWTISITVVVVLLIGACVATYFLLPALWDESSREGLQEYIQNLGVAGIFLFLFLQVLQIVLFIIPGEVTELIAGAVYGTFGGMALCIVGIIIGQTVIFWIVRKLGRKFVEDIAGGKKLERFKFLHNEQKLERITFILYVIIGTPKDLLTYFMPLTPINPWRFMFISVAARIPGIVISTYVGKSAVDGNWVLSAIVYVSLIVVSITGIYINDRIVKKKLKPNSAANTEEKQAE